MVKSEQLTASGKNEREAEEVKEVKNEKLI
jgi:hypothetical protein